MHGFKCLKDGPRDARIGYVGTIKSVSLATRSFVANRNLEVGVETMRFPLALVFARTNTAPLAPCAGGAFGGSGVR
eukprot:15458893-Alexandrium_andersonii.AAC.1